MPNTDGQTTENNTPAGDTQNPPAPGSGETAPGSEKVSDAEAELKAARELAEQLRAENSRLKPLADKAKEVEKAKRTEAERIEALEKELAESRMQALRATVSKSSGIPGELLHGSTEDELQESAKAISDLVEARVAEAIEAAKLRTPVLPSVPGEKPGGSPVSEGDWLRSALLKK
ncbi:hypothetical protein OS128_05190 [Corynebacterium sp. P5848]|uniref:hypothetical protein n=1 Tax=Corynebacterium marambiense TaxID=2765364 RepID=UPI0022608BBB|nr:hypothetical protein [Corynebacterium marambiense]MCX7542305.1 hypothetical protein [Corynebacterium marambiense]